MGWHDFYHHANYIEKKKDTHYHKKSKDLQQEVHSKNSTHTVIHRLSMMKQWLSSTLWRDWLLISWHWPVVGSILGLRNPRQGLSPVGRLLVALVARLRLPVRRPRVSLLVYTHCIHIPKLTSPAKKGGEKWLLLDRKPIWSASQLLSNKWEIPR